MRQHRQQPRGRAVILATLLACLCFGCDRSADDGGGKPALQGAAHGRSTGSPQLDPLRSRLTRLQYEVTQNAGTEKPFTGKYWETKAPGTYHCIVCNVLLFRSTAKYNSGTGWPSFFQAASEEAVITRHDDSFSTRRTEVLCSNCNAHLGHLFPDGPLPTRQRYCMNSAALSHQAIVGPLPEESVEQ